jgi:hypothetical protein
MARHLRGMRDDLAEAAAVGHEIVERQGL